MDPRPRIAITGIGAITALGQTREETWRRLCAGESGIRPVSAWDASGYRSQLAGEIAGFDPLRHFDRRRARRLDRCHQLAIVAAREAIADASLGAGLIDPSRIGISLGTSLGGMIAGQRYDRALVRSGRHLRALLYAYPLHVCLDELTQEFGFTGPRTLVSTACTASTVAIACAAAMLQSDQADAVLTGGVDPLAEFSFAGFSSMQNMSASACAPFSTPIGLNTGEGAGILVLERLDRAQARGASVYGEVAGFALTADAFHPTSPEPTGQSQRRVCLDALAAAGLTPEDVDYVNAHGTGTTGNDAVESRAIRMVLGGRAASVPVSSLKGAFGHTLGAAGGVETAMTALAVARDILPPTANFDGPREGCDLDYAGGASRAQRVDVALKQNFAFGGNNCALVVTKPGRAPLAPRVSHRVVITGLGLVTPIGSGVEAVSAALRGVQSGITPIALFDTAGLSGRVAAAVNDFTASRFTRADTRRMDRLGQLTVAAAELAFADAGLKITRETSEHAGLVVGTMDGPLGSCRQFHRELALGSPAKANPAIFPNTVFNAGIGLASIHLRLKGCNVTVTTGQASGLNAIAVAADLIREGAADAIAAGGIDACTRAASEGYAAARLSSPWRGGGAEGSWPFDARHNGFVLGEGGVLFILEPRDRALARGARIYGEIAGHATGADRPVSRGWDDSGEGVARVMRQALARARVASGDVDAIGAGAMSDPLHDAIEARAIRGVFPSGPPVFAISSLVGTSSVTAPLSLAAAILGTRGGFLPAGAALDRVAPDCDLPFSAGAVRPGSLRTAVINSASLGGTNVSLVLRCQV